VEKYDTATQVTDDNITHALHTGYLRLETHTENM